MLGRILGWFRKSEETAPIDDHWGTSIFDRFFWRVVLSAD